MASHGCQFPGCATIAAVSCECTSPPSCFCIDHMGQHMISGIFSIHKYSRLHIEISKTELDNLLGVKQRLVTIKRDLSQQILSTASGLMRELEGKTTEMLEMVQEKISSYLLLVEQIITNRVMLEECRDKTMKKMMSGEFKYKYGVRNDLKVHLTLEGWDKEYLFYFEQNTRRLRKVGTDGKFSVIEMASLPEVMGAPAAICQLDEKRMFYYYCCLPPNSSCYIINHEEKTCKSLVLFQPPSVQNTATKLGDNIYVFGGSNGRFSLEEEKWYDIAPLPQGSQNIVVAKIENSFVMTGFQMTAVYLYDPLQNPCLRLFSVAQGFKYIIKGKDGKVFLLNQSDKSIYQSHYDNLCNWIRVGSFTLNFNYLEHPPTRINDKIYFILVGHRLLEFDEDELLLKEIPLSEV